MIRANHIPDTPVSSLNIVVTLQDGCIKNSFQWNIQFDPIGTADQYHYLGTDILCTLQKTKIHFTGVSKKGNWHTSFRSAVMVIKAVNSWNRSYYTILPQETADSTRNCHQPCKKKSSHESYPNNHLQHFHFKMMVEETGLCDREWVLGKDTGRLCMTRKQGL